jgi:hypothetical protein
MDAHLRGFLVGLLGVVVINAPATALSQTENQVRLAFRYIRNDDIPRNGSSALEWIYIRRNKLSDAMLEEVYRTDRQARDAIMSALFDVRGFDPDPKFCRLVVSRLSEQDNYVKGGDLGVAVHWKAWAFVNRHYGKFKPLLLENLHKTKDMWYIWATIYLLHYRGEIEKELPNLPANVWEMAGKSLGGDKVDWNASQAVRTYLIIGRPSLRYLEALKDSRDAQTRDYVLATIDAIGGSKRAYGYLGSQLALSRDLFEMDEREPEWMADEVDKWDPENPLPRKRYR